MEDSENKNNSNILESQTRNSILDIIRGGAIALVVIGHTYNPVVHDYIYLFHVAVFFIVSGICFNPKYTDNLNGLKDIFIKRVKSLWIPYVVWNFIFMLLQNLFVKIGLLTNNAEYFSLSPLLADGFCEIIGIKDMLRIFIRSLFFLHSRPFCGGLWFFGSLFYATVFYAIQEYIFKKIRIEKFHIAFSIAYICLGFYFVQSGLVDRVPLLKQVCMILFSESMFTFGTVIRKYNLLQLCENINKHIGLLGSFVVLLVMQHFGTISFAGVHIVDPVFFLLASLIGFLSMYYFAEEIQNIELLGNVLKSIGVHTVPILALHTLAFKVVTVIQVCVYDAPKLYLSLYPVWKNSLLWTLAYTVVGLCIPYGIALLLSKNKVCKKILKA